MGTFTTRRMEALQRKVQALDSAVILVDILPNGNYICNGTEYTPVGLEAYLDRHERKNVIIDDL